MVIYDAEHVGAVTIYESETVERIASMGPIKEIRVRDIARHRTPSARWTTPITRSS